MENIFKSTLFIFLLMTSNANAAFINGYDLSNWSQSINGGSVDISGAPDTLVLTSSNDGSNNEKNQDFTITALKNSSVSFAWNFQTNDSFNAYDPFGMLLNGVFTQLTDNLGNNNQSGIFSFNIVAGDIFGFRANSIDSMFGSSITDISAFDATPAPTSVPTPATFWLMSSSLIYLLCKKRKSIV